MRRTLCLVFQECFPDACPESGFIVVIDSAQHHRATRRLPFSPKADLGPAICYCSLERGFGLIAGYMLNQETEGRSERGPVRSVP